jgi:undecaprenyl phosphate N,N'-diacetylbacillosamine 1-phosphate transferase
MLTSKFTPVNNMYQRSALYANYLKRLLDLFVALIMFTLLFPLFVVVAIALAIANNGRPFFLQRRPGLHGRIFKVIKFKTMNDRKNKNGELLPDAVRLTPIGRFVRRTSLDEVPQLLNVIKGDMSIIGPRPLLEEYMPLYDEVQRRRHDVRPGITGWAQVNGRNTISWQQKFEYDVYYVNHISFPFDFKILLQTFKNVAKSEGISSDTSATMEKFRGS